MMERVALGTWPGGLRPYRDALLKRGDYHLEVTFIIQWKHIIQFQIVVLY